MAAGLDIKSISDLLAQQLQEEARPASGSLAALTPADIGASASSAAATESAKVAKAPRDPKAIWADDEVARDDDTLLIDADREDDGRERPKYDILYKQSVTSEDMYLGMGDKDPSSSKCNIMVIKIMLPGEVIGEVDLDVKRQAIVLRSNKYKLATYLPHPVRSDDGKAQWIKDKGQLVVSLPIIRKELWELET